uniref:Predicted RNA binding protein YcfA, dsRBD-like fold, HicA-like mRNA interferase family n=1 Tax=Candidatus Kentrum sp. TC TaxID=2126339 RepID=A0A450Y8Q6_9GAMM|nr:MAG: Predicted RNA binding protein YcfA, dsRBD-like fold, HicA-like mRNA interferase family [Candidatus Kentron sp. TC]
MLPRLPRLTDEQAERMLLGAGFERVRTKGSHGIYRKGPERFVVPFHGGKILHPKITKDLVELVENNVTKN